MEAFFISLSFRTSRRACIDSSAGYWYVGEEITNLYTRAFDKYIL